MRYRALRTYLLVPLIYVTVLLGLLFLQFSGTDSFALARGEVSLRGARDELQPDTGFADLSLRYPGMEILLDGDRSAALLQDGEEVALSVTGFEDLGQGFLVRFSDGTRVESSSGELGATLRAIVAENPDDREAGASPDAIALPFRTLRRSSVEASESGDISIREGGEEWRLLLPGTSFLKEDRIVLSLESGAAVARYVSSDAEELPSLSTWLEGQDGEATLDSFQRARAEFVERAYVGWSSSRYDPQVGGWSVGGSVSGFREETLVAYLAEAWNRNEYNRAFGEMRNTAVLHADSLTLNSAVFLGNLRSIVPQQLRADRDYAARVRQQLAGGQLEAFLDPAFLQFAVDRGGPDLLQDTRAVLDALDPAEQPSRILAALAAGAFRTSQVVRDQLGLDSSTLSAWVEALRTRLQPTDDGLFLQDDPGSVDLWYSILAGSAFRMGADLTGETDEEIGRLLIRDALRLGDPQGLLPRIVEISGRDIGSPRGTLLPETVYPWVSDNPWIPRTVSFAEELGTGTWLYTLAQIQERDISPSEIRLRIAYPRNRTHYLIWVGLEAIAPLDGMELFGITWRDDPNFERYSKGRHYDRNSQVLLIKYFDDTQAEDVVIRY